MKYLFKLYTEREVDMLFDTFKDYHNRQFSENAYGMYEKSTYITNVIEINTENKTFYFLNTTLFFKNHKTKDGVPFLTFIRKNKLKKIYSGRK